jgi:hypothetical protein
MRDTPSLPGGTTLDDLTWRAHRPRRLTQVVQAALRAAGAALRRQLAEARRRRQARANYLALCELDVGTLRDLGFHRSELMSVATEVVGGAEFTRARLAQLQHELPF